MRFLIKRLLFISALSIFTAASQAQSITSGDVTGMVNDPTGSSIPNASVTLANLNTNATQRTNTSTKLPLRVCPAWNL